MPVTVSAISGGVSIGDMQLSLLLIVIGIVLAVLVNYGLGIVCILIGLVLLIWPQVAHVRSDGGRFRLKGARSFADRTTDGV